MTTGEPQQILQYTILEKIGEGPTGEVYKAFDSGQQRAVALKILWAETTKDEAFWDVMMPRLKALQDIKYEGIAGVHSIEENDGRFIIVEEYVEGTDIVSYVHDSALSINSFLVVAQEITRALKYAHDHRILHGNLKPSNILIRSDGRVRLMDFGLSGYLTPDKFESEMSPAAVRYLAPEQIRNDAIRKETDIYSLGTIFFEALCGRPAFDQPISAEVMKAIDAARPNFKNLQAVGVSGDVIFLIEKMMSWTAADRFSTAGELLVNLQAIADYERTHPAEGPIRHTKSESPRKYLMLSILFVLLIIFWLVVTSNR